jgi:hypothetical protein
VAVEMSGASVPVAPEMSGVSVPEALDTTGANPPVSVASALDTRVDAPVAVETAWPSVPLTGATFRAGTSPPVAGSELSASVEGPSTPGRAARGVPATGAVAVVAAEVADAAEVAGAVPTVAAVTGETAVVAADTADVAADTPDVPADTADVAKPESVAAMFVLEPVATEFGAGMVAVLEAELADAELVVAMAADPEPVAAAGEVAVLPLAEAAAAEVADATVDVAAVVTAWVAEPACIAAEVIGAETVIAEVAPVAEPAPELLIAAGEVVALALDPVVVGATAAVTAEVAADAEVMAEVTGAAAEAAAELVRSVADVTGNGDEPDVAKVAACACRANSSKRTKIPAAKIATCTARRAM